jgi:hypothetical protein
MEGDGETGEMSTDLHGSERDADGFGLGLGWCVSGRRFLTTEKVEVHGRRRGDGGSCPRMALTFSYACGQSDYRCG